MVRKGRIYKQNKDDLRKIVEMMLHVLVCQYFLLVYGAALTLILEDFPMSLYQSDVLHD